MYKQTIKPICEFLDLNPKIGVYALDLQFGKINYVDDKICYSLHTRISASQKSFIVFIKNQTKMAFDENKLPPELKGKIFKIRKLTPRECFRLMGVDDDDIDKIQASGISNSAQYVMAGNSIVVDVLYHIFRKMFIETGQEKVKGQQLTLF